MTSGRANNWDVFTTISRIGESYNREIRLSANYHITIPDYLIFLFKMVIKEIVT